MLLVVDLVLADYPCVYRGGRLGNRLLRVDRLGLVKRAAAGYGAGKNEERKANCTDFSCYLQGALQVTGWRAVRVIMSHSYRNYVIA